jgi:protein-tyrosine phosphatase
MEKDKDKIKIVFVCLGNFCRSPMAEAIFKDLARRDNTLVRFDVSSAGTKDWDVGLRPDYRTRQILIDHEIPLDPRKRAQMISEREINTADYLIAMSERIAKELGYKDNVYLLLDYVDEIDDKEIPDPYPTDTFSEAFELIHRGVQALYKYLKETYLENNPNDFQ